MSEPGFREGPFDKYQKELEVSLRELYELVVGKVKHYRDPQTKVDLNDAQTKKVRTDLDKQVERVHLAAANYFGQCTERKTDIEKTISERLDVRGFERIGNALIQ